MYMYVYAIDMQKLKSESDSYALKGSRHSMKNKHVLGTRENIYFIKQLIKILFYLFYALIFTDLCKHFIFHLLPICLNPRGYQILFG